MLTHPRQGIASNPVWQPLLDLCDGVLITPKELAAHWRYDEGSLSNMRRAQRGLPWIKLPSFGAVRYRMADVLAYELAGTSGPITIERIETALATVPGLTYEQRQAVVAHLRAAFDRGPG